MCCSIYLRCDLVDRMTIGEHGVAITIIINVHFKLFAGVFVSVCG